MKTLIIPDIHNKVDQADAIIERESPDHTVFLGDYFDDFGDTPADAERVARWLAKHLQDPTKTFLWGNHDLQYAYPSVGGLRCSGFTFGKLGVIEDILGVANWDQLRLSYWLTPTVLLTHAGVHPTYYRTNDAFRSSVNVAQKALNCGCVDAPAMLSAGRSRGGDERFGGITWLDWNEDTTIPGIIQIVGHTPASAPRSRRTYPIKGSEVSRAFCLDTHLRHHATIITHSENAIPLLHIKESRTGDTVGFTHLL